VISPRCKVTQAHLAQYVDGALRDEETAAVREHLRVCERCAEAERVARAIPTLLANPIDPLPPRTLLPRVLSAVQRLKRAERRAAALVAATILMAAMAALAGGGPLVDSGALQSTLEASLHLKPPTSDTEPAVPGASPTRTAEPSPTANAPSSTPTRASVAPSPAAAAAPTPPPPAPAGAAGFAGVAAKPGPTRSLQPQPTWSPTACPTAPPDADGHAASGQGGADTQESQVTDPASDATAPGCVGTGETQAGVAAEPSPSPQPEPPPEPAPEPSPAPPSDS
jgi:hypothetical protein